VTYFAALLARYGEDWKGQEVDLDQVEDLDTLAEVMADPVDVADPALLLVEQEDEWFAVVRVDNDDVEPRVFVSDVRAVATSSLRSVLLPPLVADAADPGDVNGEAAELTPAGPDPGLLDDLGVGEDALLEMCGAGLLPADALTSLAEQAGCLPALERLR